MLDREIILVLLRNMENASVFGCKILKVNVCESRYNNYYVSKIIAVISRFLLSLNLIRWAV